ncbi:MAG: carboxymuconolactone decarboxylase [Cupriavidus sp.]|nr:carboxymuconolactone decarboxylase [Cupriavidus sp.]
MKPEYLAALTLSFGLAAVQPAWGAQPAVVEAHSKDTTMNQQQNLSDRQQAILPIGAFTATGDMPRLREALNRGLDSGLTVNEIKEMLVQLYAYVGFPRSLNALGEFMAVLQQREARGVKDDVGRTPGPLPSPEQMLAAGTANQTKLVGAPVSGALYDFAPAVDEYLKAHLFGAVFARDNLDWQARELTTVGALSALDGVGPQVQSHMNISLNVGLSEAQLREAIDVLRAQVGPQAAENANAALERQLATR